jgi:hypothetical protein
VCVRALPGWRVRASLSLYVWVCGRGVPLTMVGFGAFWATMPFLLCRPDLPGGAAATAVVVDGAVMPYAVATAGFVYGHAEVTVSGLTPGTRYSLRCRCELEDPDVDPDSLWSPRIDVVTLDVAGLEVGRSGTLDAALVRSVCLATHRGKQD